ncbi:MAG: START domain-containing protein [Desulfosudaceae bacterium]
MKQTAPVILIAFLVMCLSLPAAASGEWELEKEKDGVSTYSREVEGSDYSAFKATAEIDATMAAVGDVLRDVPNFPEWMAKIKDAEIVKKHNANDMDVYLIMDFPWPTKDRDVVTQARTTVDSETGDLKVNTTILEDTDIPEKDKMVRLPELTQQFVLKFIEMDKTEISFSVHMEAGGSLPSSLVNRETEKVPSESLVNLQEFVRQEKYQKADPFSKINMPITQAITTAILSKYIKDQEIIDMVINDKELIKITMEGGYGEDGMEQTSRAVLKKYVKTQAFAERIEDSTHEEELALLAEDDDLLEEVLDDDELAVMVLSSGDLTGSIAERVAEIVEDEVD